MERSESAPGSRRPSPARTPARETSPPAASPPLERHSGPPSRNPYGFHSRAASRMSLHEMVKEEEEKDLEEDADLRRSNSAGSLRISPPSAKQPTASPSGMNAVEALSQRRAQRKRAMFSLQVNDLVSPLCSFAGFENC